MKKTTKLDVKHCSGCTRNLDRSCFFKSKTHKDGLHYYCKDCSREINRKYLAKNKDRIHQRNKEYRQEHKEEIAAYRKLYGQTPQRRYHDYSREKRNNIPFELTFEEFMTFWQQPCSYCGDPIQSIGIDRISAQAGYSLENCVSCCWICNCMKLDHEHDFWLKHMQKILTHMALKTS